MMLISFSKMNHDELGKQVKNRTKGILIWRQKTHLNEYASPFSFRVSLFKVGRPVERENYKELTIIIIPVVLEFLELLPWIDKIFHHFLFHLNIIICFIIEKKNRNFLNLFESFDSCEWLMADFFNCYAYKRHLQQRCLIFHHPTFVSFFLNTNFYGY